MGIIMKRRLKVILRADGFLRPSTPTAQIGWGVSAKWPAFLRFLPRRASDPKIDLPVYVPRGDRATLALRRRRS